MGRGIFDGINGMNGIIEEDGEFRHSRVKPGLGFEFEFSWTEV